MPLVAFSQPGKYDAKPSVSKSDKLHPSLLFSPGDHIGAAYLGWFAMTLFGITISQPYGRKTLPTSWKRFLKVEQEQIPHG